ncbi:MAG: class I SAM-dependent methyltransferase [Rhodothermales bacterium]|nr:class I SAM-dependent methyltransferase [Rhodothermales bacterium]
MANAALAARTQDIYERHAARFDAERPKRLHERQWLDRFLKLVRPGGRILDLGCGAGDPITTYLRSRGFDIVGADASRAMISIARERYPGGDWRRLDMRELELPERFDGVISWNAFFHLMPDEQREVLRRIVEHMNAAAAFLLTVGPEAGEVTGRVGGEVVYHASLAPDEYSGLLADMGIDVVEFVAEDPACDEQTVLLARKRTAEQPARSR